MAKDPAFLFYPNDWIGGTMGMTFEEKGAYMELLMLQFNRGHMTKHIIGRTVGQLWDNIEDKFRKDDKGLYFNERLEIEKIKRKKYTESRHNNTLGVNQYTKNNENKEGHMTSHMENENKDVFINNKEEKEILKNWKYEKSDFLKNEQWQYRFCSDKRIDKVDLEILMKDFISNIELKEDFKEAKELRNHFTNLFDKNKRDKLKTELYKIERKTNSVPLKTF